MKRVFAAVLALTAVTPFACGGKTGDGTGNSNDGGTCGDCVDAGTWLDAPWLDDTWKAPACGQISPVLGGSTYVGAWTFDANAHHFVRESKCDPGGSPGATGSRKLVVPTFFLMAEPATNLCYSECVKRGACTAPVHDIADPDPRTWLDDHRALEPVYADHDQADTFCKWLGGRLPTWAELTRAAQGDAEVLGVDAMTKAAVDCIEQPSNSQLCGQIAQMDFFPSGGGKPNLYPVGQVSADVGPFTHRDLFGSVFEWTDTYYRQDQFCTLADGANDFGSFPQTDAKHPQHLAIQYASGVARSVQNSKDEFVAGLAPDATVSYYIGFRCAFSR